MSLAQVSPLVFWLGLIGLASVLFALQCLRVRHRRIDVVTTLFWSEAIEESRARVLFKRFRHPWSYLLVLAIAGLIWLAWAEPRSTGDSDRESVLLVDGSAGMALGSRFEDTLALLKRDVVRFPTAQRRVFWCGGDTRLLLDRGEESILLEARLEGLRPEATSRGLERACLTLARELQDDREVDLVLYGDGTIDQAVRDILPDSMALHRAAVPPEPGKDVNQGIRALGMTESNADFEAVDLYFRTSIAEANFSFHLGDQPYAGEAMALDPGEWLLRGVPARGEAFSVRLLGNDALSVDDSASIQLPFRERIRVGLSEDAPAVLRQLVAGDPALQVVEIGPAVAIGTGLEGVPSLQWTSSEEEGDAFVFVVKSDAGAGEADDLFVRLGMNQIDATGLAQASGRIIRLSVQQGETRSVRLWEELLTGEFNLTKSAAFPLFVAQAIRWLAEVEPVDPYVSVGEAHPLLTAAESVYAPPRVGAYRDGDGMERIASLAEDPLPVAEEGTAEIPRLETLASAVGGQPWMTWLILIVLVLLGLEWVLFQKGRVP